MTVFVVCDGVNGDWAVLGVFSSRAKAEQAVTDANHTSHWDSCPSYRLGHCTYGHTPLLELTIHEHDIDAVLLKPDG